MSDKNVDKWKQKGHIYLWHYVENTRNYSGWNLTADETFCDSFADLIETMMVAQYNCQKSIFVASPTKEVLSVPNNQGGQAKWKSPEILILKHQKDKVAEDYFTLEESANTVIISAGRQKLELLKECVLKTPKQIDYSIQVGSTRLWFW